MLFRKAFVAGTWVGATKSFPVHSPLTGLLIADVADLERADAARAIEAAHHSMQDWKKRSAVDRAQVMMRWHELQVERKEELAELLRSEQGKPLAEALGEVEYGASYIKWFAEEGQRSYGSIIPGPAANKRIHVIKQPVGVVAAITPWNFPNAMIQRKAAAALAAGCGFVVRPSEHTPLSALILAELAEEAGVPAGLFNVVTSTKSAEIGEELTTHPLVRKISFTGSTAVGKILMKQAAGTVKRVSMELGGNAPFLVFESADLDKAVDGLLASKFRNYGQTCVCTNRILVQRSVHQDFIAKLKKRMSEVVSGPLIHKQALEKVQHLVDDAVAKGARVVTGGNRVGDTHEYAPTLLTDVTGDAELVSEEIFGPVAAVRSFDTEEEAITLANDTNVGLASYFYSQNVHQCHRVSEALEYGMVGVNSGLISTAVAPFGGIKESGMGREGSHYGLDDYQNIKYIGHDVD